ncbi:hypothetical protein [Fodinibius sp. Rm-B-1B1-1]|uniref:hypothetical protein n=1 Tax=Fodinibius alkaliphilus TaxID=3140241 RepID=UPI00315AFCE5
MNWTETEYRFTAFFDLMGFKNYVFRNKHSYVKKRMVKLHEIINSVEELDEPLSQGKPPRDLIKTLIFSDSILLTTKNKSSDSLFSIVLTSGYIMARCMVNRIPIKGAISYGQITADFDKSLFFGKSLIDAYQLQDELFMYGVIFDHKAEKKINKNRKQLSDIITKTKVPTKSGNISHFAINWTKFFSLIEGADRINNSIQRKLYEQVSGEARKYVDNTIEFIDQVNNNAT